MRPMLFLTSFTNQRFSYQINFQYLKPLAYNGLGRNLESVIGSCGEHRVL